MKFFIYAYLILAACLLQGCFEIVEQVFIKNDGSGNLQLVLNMSKSKTKLNSISKMKTINGHEVPTREAITKQVNDLAATIKKTSGISNIKTNLDFDNYIATFSCDFTSVNSLNAAVKHIGEKQNSQHKAIEKSYEFDGVNKVFSRLNKYSLKGDYEKMSNADKEVFATAGYTAIYKFEKDIAAATNANSKIAGNKKALMLKLNVLDIINGKKSIENKITLLK